MDIEPKDANLIMRIFSFAGGVIATGSVALYKLNEQGKQIKNHGKEIDGLKKSKIDKADCKTIQVEHKEKFIDGNKEFREVKQLIRDSEVKMDDRLKEFGQIQKSHHDDLMRVILETLKQ